MNDNFSDALDEEGTTSTFINRVAVKLPAFWRDRPTTWFTIAEAQFALQGITSDLTKYYHIVAALDHQVISDIEDVLANPPHEDKYDHLKETLISRLSLTTEERIRQILYREELDGRKPSQFLRHLRSLAGNTPIPDEVLRTAWKDRLPHAIHPILNSHLKLSLDELALVADQVLQAHPGSSPCLALSSPPLEILASNMELLSNQVAALQNRQRKPNRRRVQSQSSDQVSRTQGFCYYHRCFGQAARKCESPCTFHQSGNDKGSQQ